MKKNTKKNYKKKHASRKRRHYGGKIVVKDPMTLQPIPLPSVPSPINPVNTNHNISGGRKYTKIRRSRYLHSKTYKGGFKADVVDNLEDRDDDWIITKQ